MKFDDVFEAFGILELWALQQDGRGYAIVREPDGKLTVAVGEGEQEFASTTVRDVHQPLVPIVHELIERLR